MDPITRRRYWEEESWEAKAPGREAHDRGSRRGNRLYYLSLQHELVERVHDSEGMWKKDLEE